MAGANPRWTLDEAQLGRCCQPLIARLQQPVMQALHDARFSLQDLDHVLLVGGATRMPLVRRAVARLFGRFPVTTFTPMRRSRWGRGTGGHGDERCGDRRCHSHRCDAVFAWRGNGKRESRRAGERLFCR